MSQTATLPVGARFDDDAPPALRVRGYWSSVGYRLRHDPVDAVLRRRSCC